MPIARISRVLSASILVLVLVATLIGAVKIASLSTLGLYRQIGGIAIAPGSDHINIMRSQLDCATLNPDGARESCTVTVAGDVLVAAVTHDSLNHFGFADCQVTFRGRSFGCWAATPTITSSAHIAIADLGLTDAETRTLQQHYFIASRDEAGWRDLAQVTAMAIAASAALVVLAWTHGRLRKRLALATAGSAGTFVSAYVALTLFLLGTNIID